MNETEPIYITQLKDSIINLDRKLDISFKLVKDDIGEIKSDITGIKGEITGMKGEITGMKGEITGMKGEITGLKGEITGLKGEIVEIKGDIVKIKEDIIDMKDDIIDMKDDINKTAITTKNNIDNIDWIRENMVTKEDIADMVTKYDISDMATKSDIKPILNLIGSYEVRAKNTEDIVRHDHKPRIIELEKRVFA